MTNSTADLPRLYSFRRCPYAMRARYALARAGVRLELREVLLKDKPEAMLELSPKGTVPVLQLPDGSVIDESRDVVQWALSQYDPDDWLAADPDTTRALIDENDDSFKAALDRYKYHTRHPERTREQYRREGEVFLQKLEDQLATHHGAGLTRPSTALADAAIFPFIRQFANSDREWFDQAPYPLLQQWLGALLGSARFKRIMEKYPLWQAGDKPLIVNWANA